MSSAATAINILRAVNMALTLSRELGVGYQELIRVIDQAGREDRDVQIEDLEGLTKDVVEARDRLQQAINEARE